VAVPKGAAPAEKPKAKAAKPKAKPVPVRVKAFKLYSLSTLATEFHMERPTIVRKLGAAGVKSAGTVRGYPGYKLLDACQAIFAAVADPDAGAPKVQSSDERARYYNAELRGLELATKQKLVVPAVEVEATVGDLFRIVTQFLNGLTDKVEREAGLMPEQAAALNDSIAVCRRELYKLLRRAFADPSRITEMPPE
jgi:hypothetical protein